MSTPSKILDKIENIIPHFERRKSQRLLAEFIWDLIKNGGVGIAEAPTGIGKTLAYLIPTLLIAKTSKKPIIISTNTINLQHQLIHKDIPALKNLINAEVKVALGRTNYLCLSKLYSFISRKKPSLLSPKNLQLFTQLTEHPTGEKSDITKKLDEPTWDRICSSSYSCLKSKCPYFKRCFFYKARRNLESADIIIANHHIILSDINMESGILPEYNTIIFDEAHNLEKNATLYFTKTISSNLLNLVSKLSIDNPDNPLKALEVSSSTLNLISTFAIKHSTELSIIFSSLNNMIPDSGEKYLKNTHILHPHLKTIIQSTAEFLSVIDKTQEEWNGTQAEGEITDIINRLQEASATAEEILHPSRDEETIIWLKKLPNQVHINSTPAKPDKVLAEKLYPRLKTMILLSATLSIGGDFTYIKSTFGLDNPKTAVFENEFDYQKQCKLLVVKDAPDPRSTKFTLSLSNSIIEAARGLKSHGGMIILFTSHSMLNKTYELSYPILNGMGYTVLKQGETDRFEMLARFKLEESILFGTNSFWEGIDVKGNRLSIVFITKLPFDVPDSAIEKARYDMFKESGRNGFIEYSLPKAVLKFKQGFGRLIRSKTDMGLIITTDSRILTKFYGRFFIKSLPKVRVEVVHEKEISSSVSNFFSHAT